MAEAFIGSEAVSAGQVTRHELQRFYRPIFRGVYLPKSAEPTLRDRTVAAWLASGRRGVVAGLAASSLHGASWVDHDVPIELVSVKCRRQEGLIARHERIGADEVTRIAGLPVTNRVRTAFDLGRYQPRARAMGCLDALMRNQVFALDEVAGLSERYPKVRGVRRQRPGATAHARGAWLDRHPRHRRRIARCMDRADDRCAAEPGLSHRDRRNAAIYSTFRCITQLSVFARPLEQTFAVL